MDFSLTQIHRQAEGSAIIRYSVGLRTGDPNALFFTGRDNGDDGGALMRVKMSFLRDSHFVRADQVICGKNDTRHRLNARIREHLGHRSPYPQNGDKVICLRNNTQRMLVNGMIGRATRDGYDYDTSKGIFHMDVEIDGQTMINLPVFLPYFTDPGNEEAWEGVPKWSKYNKEHYHFDYGYAITAHKCVSPGTIVHLADLV